MMKIGSRGGYLLPARLHKHDGVNYLPKEKHTLCELGCRVSNTITSHYYMGPYNHKDVAVIEVRINEK